MQPFTFVKEHPVGFTVSAAFGMFAGPWILSTVQRYTGVSVGIPSFHGASVNTDAG